jgi:hypothetical protein
MDGLNSIEDVAFRAAERGETQMSELRLQLADIMAAKREIVREVSGAGSMRFVNR